MSDRSKIEWTDSTWNPIRARNLATGKIGWHCEHVSPGCEHCYAEGINKRLGTGLPFKPGHRKDIDVFLDEKMLMLPLRWKKPRTIFVNSMSDTFASFVTDEMIDRMFAVMALTPQHRFQVLTKRAKRMREYCSRIENEPFRDTVRRFANAMPPHPWPDFKEMVFPCPNVWLGVSAEDQERWDERKEHLRNTPAAVRFASFEPLLGPIVDGDFAATIQWAIVGGESGPQARPMHPDWARSIRDQCKAAGIPFFFKQWGEWAPFYYRDDGEPRKTFEFDDGRRVHRIGRANADRILDNCEHNGMPA